MDQTIQLELDDRQRRLEALRCQRANIEAKNAYQTVVSTTPDSAAVLENSVDNSVTAVPAEGNSIGVEVASLVNDATLSQSLKRDMKVLLARAQADTDRAIHRINQQRQQEQNLHT